MIYLNIIVTFAATLTTIRGSQARLDLTSSSNIAMYWGQNSYNQASGQYAQRDLAYYCQNADIDVFQLAFVTVINGVGGAPEVNFANAGNNCTIFENTNLLNCPEIGQDIKTCQSLGKTILLSIGGATYTEVGFSTAAKATAGAQLIWETFGPVTNPSVHRPFGSAVIDGFDFDFESSVSNMATFGNRLYSLFSQDTSKQYYLTAAPQCPYPDVADNPMLDHSVHFDAIWVQFYNNYCGLNSYVAGTTTQHNFDFSTWDNWAHKTSINPDVRIFLGVPGNIGAAGSGYVSVSSLASIITYVQSFTSFGGVMVWDASQAYANVGFISGVHSALTRGSSGTTTTQPPNSLSTAIQTQVSSTALFSTASSVLAGTSCPTNGAYICRGTNIAVCSNGVWVTLLCSSGLVCANYNSLVYCDYPKSTVTLD